jgi:hypothetical protein
MGDATCRLLGCRNRTIQPYRSITLLCFKLPTSNENKRRTVGTPSSQLAWLGTGQNYGYSMPGSKKVL